jgi:hypothetical protein
MVQGVPWRDGSRSAGEEIPVNTGVRQLNPPIGATSYICESCVNVIIPIMPSFQMSSYRDTCQSSKDSNRGPPKYTSNASRDRTVTHSLTHSPTHSPLSFCKDVPALK